MRNLRTVSASAYHPAMLTHQAAEALGILPGTIRRQILLGKLRAVRHGRDWWITDAEVERYRRESRGQRLGPARKVSAK